MPTYARVVVRPRLFWDPHGATFFADRCGTWEDP